MSKHNKLRLSEAAAFGVYKTSYVVLLQQNYCKLLIYKNPDFWLIFIGCSIG